MKLLFSSLKIQLLCTIIGSIGATAITLTTLAYRAQVVNLERDARRTVHAAAQSRAEAVMRLLDGQQQRAQRFLTTAVALCAEVTPAGARAWELGCARRAVREFRASERAAGVSLSNRRGRIARSGAAILGDVPIPSPLARLIARDGQTRYTILAENQNTAVRLQFTLGELSALFEQPVGLGTSGEVFLSDSSGTILTPTRFRAATVPGALAAGHSCASGPFERHDVDYRGVGVIQGAVSVSAFAQPLCVDAHVSLQEALAPAADLLGDLIRRTALLCGVGALLGLLAAYRISAPVQRLAASARALEGGDFARPIPMSGPSEIQALARALERMARELGEQMARARRARQDAEHANRAKDDFLAVLSHELRTPLTSTLGWTRLLRHKRFNAQQTDQAIGAIERSAQTQKRLIEDLLDVSRIVAGRLQLDLTMVRVTMRYAPHSRNFAPRSRKKGSSSTPFSKPRRSSARILCGFSRSSRTWCPTRSNSRQPEVESPFARVRSTTPWHSPSRTPGLVSTPSSCRGYSNGFNRRTPDPGVRMAGSAWDSRSSSISFTCTAARSRRRAWARVSGRASRCDCRSRQPIPFGRCRRREAFSGRRSQP
jgi:HAMP domain-containing protein